MFVVTAETGVGGFLLAGGQGRFLFQYTFYGLAEIFRIVEGGIVGCEFRETHVNGVVDYLRVDFRTQAGPVPRNPAFFAFENQ